MLLFHTRTKYKSVKHGLLCNRSPQCSPWCDKCRSQPHSPSWAKALFSSFFLKFPSISIFFHKISLFLSLFWFSVWASCPPPLKLWLCNTVQSPFSRYVVCNAWMQLCVSCATLSFMLPVFIVHDSLHITGSLVLPHNAWLCILCDTIPHVTCVYPPWLIAYVTKV